MQSRPDKRAASGYAMESDATKGPWPHLEMISRLRLPEHSATGVLTQTRAALSPPSQLQHVHEAERIDLVLVVRDVHDRYVRIIGESANHLEQAEAHVALQAVGRLIE